MKKNLLFAGLGLASSCISVNAMPPDEKWLDTPLAGSWYEADPAWLRSQIDRWVRSASLPEKLPDAPPAAIISPHAGYVYSGPTAACGYKTLQGRKFDRVIVIGPSHHVYLKNQLCIPAAAGMKTPLGPVPFDREALTALAKQPFVLSDDRIHFGEHSVQLQFPFLQCVLKDDFKTVPVIAGQLDAGSVRQAARALKTLVTPSTLVVISSDFTHYGRDFGYVPFRENIAENLKKLDFGAFEMIKTLSADRFADYIERTGATICGEAPIRILLEMLSGPAEVTLLKYANSADGNRDYSHCVSYVSGLVSASWKQESPDDSSFAVLRKEDRRILLKLARDAIAYVFEHRREMPREEVASRSNDFISKKMACFVTLKIGEDLRGCIGEIEPFRPLCQSVAGRAVDAAFRDPRFPQLTPSEFRRVEIEISALTPARPVSGWREIEIGRHGMTLSRSGRSAVFLPQVAPEQGWGIEETLTHLSMKAGLPPDAWREGASFTVFEAIVFKESDFGEAGR